MTTNKTVLMSIFAVTVVLVISGLAVFDYTQDNKITDASSDLSSENISDLNQNAYAAKDKLYVPRQQFTPEISQPFTFTYPDQSGQDRTVHFIIRYPMGISEPQPVVVWSHGGSSQNPSTTLQQLNDLTTQAGYVSVAVAHPPRSDQDIQELCIFLGFTTMNNDDCGTFSHLTWDKPQDLVQVLDKLDQLPLSLRNMMDLENIAVAGHSGGSSAALMLAGMQRAYHPIDPNNPSRNGFTVVGPEDFSHPDPKAFLALSPESPMKPGFFDTGFDNPESSWDGVDIPVLMATGDGDSTCAPRIIACLSGETPLTKKIPFQRMPADGDKFLLYINDVHANHSMFKLDPADCEGIPNNFDECQLFVNWISSSSLAFFDANLRDIPAAQRWLDSDRIERASQGIAEMERK